jgi:DNA-binding MurR/RpiR family transcriptional regulator
MVGRSIQAKVAGLADSLPESQRRVADLVVSDPQSVAFGTLASVAEQAATSTPTVIRFAAQLGFDGFTALRDAVRSEVSGQLRSAASRLRRSSDEPLIEEALRVERENVERTFAQLDPTDLDRAVELVSDTSRRLWVLANSQLAGLGGHLADELQLCRDRVVRLEGSEFRIATTLGKLRAGDVLVSIDTQRHEGWFVRVQRQAVGRGAVPLDLTGGVAMTFACETTSPFESQVGVLALGNLLVAAVVDRLRSDVTERVDVLERLWVDDGLFD